MFVEVLHQTCHTLRQLQVSQQSRHRNTIASDTTLTTQLPAHLPSAVTLFNDYCTKHILLLCMCFMCL